VAVKYKILPFAYGTEEKPLQQNQSSHIFQYIASNKQCHAPQMWTNKEAQIPLGLSRHDTTWHAI